MSLSRLATSGAQGREGDRHDRQGNQRHSSAAGKSRHFEFRWPWLPDNSWETTVSITLEAAGYGTLMTLTDGPFDLRVPGVLDAWAEANEGWGEALAWLRGYVDFSVELRDRRY